MNRLAICGVALALGASLATPAHADRYNKNKNRNADDRYWHDRYENDRNGTYHYGYSDRWTTADAQRLRQIADRLETDTDRLKKYLNENLDDSRLNGTDREDNINDVAQALEDAADRLEKQSDDRADARASAREVFLRANELDEQIRRFRLDNETNREWNRVNADLNQLATLYPSVADRDEWEERGWNRGHRSEGWREMHRGY